MSPGIFVVEGKELVEMVEEPYAAEAVLQELLERYPTLLTSDQGEGSSRRAYVLVKREAGVPVAPGGADKWSVDHLFLDQEGIPTLVEVKRSTNTEIRRQVVGQMLDYAANAILYWPVERLRADFEGTCAGQQVDPEDALRPLLEEDSDSEEFWERVKTNLAAHRVRMVFVADSIPIELQTIVEFLNEQLSAAEVLAIEVKQYGGQELKTLVSRVIGQTATAQQVKSSGDIGPKAKLYQQFWSELLPRLREAYPNWVKAKAPPRGAWIELPAGKSGIFYSANFTGGPQLRFELYIDPYDQALQNNVAYERLAKHKADVEQAFAKALSWEPLESRRAARIATYLDNGDVSEQEKWPLYMQWFLDTAGPFRRAVQPFVDAL